MPEARSSRIVVTGLPDTAGPEQLGMRVLQGPLGDLLSQFPQVIVERRPAGQQMIHLETVQRTEPQAAQPGAGLLRLDAFGRAVLGQIQPPQDVLDGVERLRPLPASARPMPSP